MNRSRPPVIAAWLLRRFALGPDADAIAGDLLEHYQRGRSAAWYWREVFVAILAATWSESRQHPFRLLGAVAAGWIVTAVLGNVMLPYEYAWVVRYGLHHQAGPEQMPLVGFAMSAPFAVLFGWIVARCARSSRASAVLVATGVSVLDGVIAIWMNAQAWPAGAHFSVWPWLWPMPLYIVLVLVGGGMFAGAPRHGGDVHSKAR
jgi:hypothetical protein